MLLPLQRLLETIYDARCGHDVRDFLITGRDQLPRERRAAAAAEELVLVQKRRASYLALYIDEAVLARLRDNDPLRALDSSNIADFWIALEGVSHFSYLKWKLATAWRVAAGAGAAGRGGQVHRLVLAAARTVPGHRPRELHPLLFARTRINPALPVARQHLYAAASRYAGRFCAALQSSLFSSRPAVRSSGVTALRRFYRLGSTSKMRHIEALA